MLWVARRLGTNEEFVRTVADAGNPDTRMDLAFVDFAKGEPACSHAIPP
jgi:hypothetical protein